MKAIRFANLSALPFDLNDTTAADLATITRGFPHRVEGLGFVEAGF